MGAYNIQLILGGQDFSKSPSDHAIFFSRSLIKIHGLVISGNAVECKTLDDSVTRDD